MERLQPTCMTGGNFNVTDQAKFEQAIKLLKESLFDGGATFFCSDNLITWNKNLSFLRDDFYLNILGAEANSFVEKSIIWRTYTLLYFANLAGSRAGDFIELGCHAGFTALQVIKRTRLEQLGKAYYLYDLFEWNEGDAHTLLEGHKNPQMFEDVCARFEAYPFVKVIKGSVPQSFEQDFPEQIAFAHIDMNHPVPEAGALEMVLPRLSPGGIVIFDDYGWWGYSAQKQAIDPIVARYGLSVLEMPTGQGLLIKP